MNLITDINQLDTDKVYSYADYLLWRFSERVELIKGKIFRMSPSPSEVHQRISFNILKQLADYLNNNPCSVYHAPFDVRFPNKQKEGDKEIYTVVQPDIVIICDHNKIDEKGCVGAPDVVFEILSKSSSNRDLHEKYELYESSGVLEYWIVSPVANTIQINVLDDEGKYMPGKLLTSGDTAKSRVINGLVINIDNIFPNIVEEPMEPYGPNVRRL